MPARFLISSQTLSTAAASVTFSAIPATYTDLVLKMTTRMATGTFGEFSVQFGCMPLQPPSDIFSRRSISWIWRSFFGSVPAFCFSIFYCQI